MRNKTRKARTISRRTGRRRSRRANRAEVRYSLADFRCEFPDDDVCLDFIKEQRWPHGLTQCEKCGVERKHHRVTGRTAYACDRCGNHIYPLRDTLFARSSTPLTTWFYVIYLLTFAEARVSARRIQRETGVTYKTAWRALCLLRPLMASGLSPFTIASKRVELSNVFNIQQKRQAAEPAYRQQEAAAGAA